MTKLLINITSNKLTLLGYLCFFLAFIFGIVGMAIDPVAPNYNDDHYTHFNTTMKNATFSMFAQTLALLGLGFLYIGKH